MSVPTEYADAIGRYAARPTQIPWAGWKRVAVRTYQQIGKADLSLRCAGVAFFAFLSVFPVLACFVLVYGLFADTTSLNEHMSAVRQLAPQSVMNVIEERLNALLSQPQVGLGVGLVVSFLIALWSGSRGTNALVDTVSSAYHEDEERHFLASAFLSLGLTLGALVFTSLALFTVAILPALISMIAVQDFAETIALWARWPALAFFVVISICVLFRLAPHRHGAKWSWIMPGAILATVLWIALSVLFSIYVEQFSNYSATFGSLSVAVVMMLWIYYSTMVIALGAALNAELEHQTKVDTTVGPNAPMGERNAHVADTLPEPNVSSRVS